MRPARLAFSPTICSRRMSTTCFRRCQEAHFLGGTSGAFSVAPRFRSVNPLRGKATHWRAGCGRSACPVRREGERSTICSPYPYRFAAASPCCNTSGCRGASATRSSTACSRSSASNWKGRPLISYETVANLVGCTRRTKGSTVKAHLDLKVYETGVKIPDGEMEQTDLHLHKPHPNWNCTIAPSVAER